jgi:transposase
MIKRSIEDIKILYATLNNESEVAAELGVSRQSMYDYRIRHNIPYNPGKAKSKKLKALYGERNEQIKVAYLAGTSVEEICKKHEMNKPALNYILTKLGIKHAAVRPSEQRNEKIFELRKQGIPVKEIAVKFDLKPFYVSSILYKIRKDKKKKR